VWSVAHSKLRRNLCASASDDGTAALWSGVGLSGRAAPPLNPARGCPVTCVDFSAEDGNALLVACANGAAYVYDLRNRCAAACVCSF
jgi:WD40 repeat protein